MGNLKRKMCFLATTVLIGTAWSQAAESAVAESAQTVQQETSLQEAQTALSEVDSTKWQYQEEDDVYWQTGILYCAAPSDAQYETLSIYVPGAYMDGEANGDGTYTCRFNTEAGVRGYTCETAPLVIPIETQNYDPVKAPEEYVAQAAAYTSSGFLFIEAGCRGKEAGAPAGVADLKAAIRYLRYSSAEIPGNKDRIFVYGTGSGGALGEVLAASGNSALYTPYLEAIGAAGDVSDAVAGVYETDAVTGMDYADAAAEWMREISEESEGTESTDVSGKAGLSRGLAVSYALYINQLGLVDEEGEPLLLSASEEGVYQDGTYCGYLKKVIEEALTQYLKEQDDRASCIQELNQDTEWVAYDEETGEAKVLNLQGYQEFQDKKQTASEKTVGAFDGLEGDQTENILFGYGDGEGAHFDQVLAKLLAEDSTYGDDYQTDLQRTDFQGNKAETRVNLYNPLYYLCSFYNGYQTGNVARYWKLQVCLPEAGEGVLTSGTNLALALKEYGADTEFETVWGEADSEILPETVKTWILGNLAGHTK